MLNAFVARFALGLVGPAGVLFDVTGNRDLPGQADRIAQAIEECPDGGQFAIFAARGFMQRRSGESLMLNVLPSWDLTHLLDLSGCYIPGHGVPTLLLVGQARPPVGNLVFVTRCVRGEPREPDDPEHGVVWSSLVNGTNSGISNVWVRCALVQREALHAHPLSFEELVP